MKSPHLMPPCLCVVMILLFLLSTTMQFIQRMPQPSASSSAPPTLSIAEDFGKLPLYFIENRGQVDSPVAFYVHGSDKTLYFTPDGVTFILSKALENAQVSDHGGSGVIRDLQLEQPYEMQNWVLKLDFVGANPDVQPTGEEQNQAIISYFIGQPSDWHTSIPTFTRLVYKNLWDGIDLVFSGTLNELKYEFVVQPGADLSLIQLAYRGANDIRVNDSGELEVVTELGTLLDDAPLAWQEMDGRQSPVEANYQLQSAIDNSSQAGRNYSFLVGDYDRAYPLILDPSMIIYAGFVGGGEYDYSYGIAVDSAGSAYITGCTWSNQSSFPVLVGPILTYTDGFDYFIAKISSNGGNLVYAGYIAGVQDQICFGDIAVDPAGAAYITGFINAGDNFPVKGGPDLTENGLKDAFIVKVNPAGNDLVYSGYIGGEGREVGYGITVDGSGAAYVTGTTSSAETSFPIFAGPDLSFNGGSTDAFVVKVRPDGSGLVYAGYIGGDSDDIAYDIAVDTSGSAYVVGDTASEETTFPVIGGPDLTFNGGYTDAFVAKVRPDGSNLVYAGYVGGEHEDTGYGIAVDTGGAAYITGETGSSQATFPVLVGPDLIFNGGHDVNNDAFVAKVGPDGSGLVYAGYIGGNGWDYGYGITVDSWGAAFVTGYTSSDQTSFPVRLGPDLTFNGTGSDDAFIVKVNPYGNRFAFAGYIGGNETDLGYGIAVDANGDVYITGATLSTEASFPVKTGPDLTFNGGAYDAFVVKISYPEVYYFQYFPAINILK